MFNCLLAWYAVSNSPDNAFIVILVFNINGKRVVIVNGVHELEEVEHIDPDNDSRGARWPAPISRVPRLPA